MPKPPKQQASLLSFFVKSGTKRPAIDDDGVEGNGSASPSSPSPSSPSPSPSPSPLATIDRAIERTRDDRRGAEGDANDPADSTDAVAVLAATSPDATTADVVPADADDDVAESSEEEEEEEEADASDASDAPSEGRLSPPSSSANAIEDDPPRRRNEDRDVGDGKKSEYELLRERNIARNEARLRALGLLAVVPTHPPPPPPRQRPAAKKRRREGRPTTTTTATTTALPTRRSTRLFLGPPPPGDADGTTTTTTTATSGGDDAAAESVEEELFAASALSEYLITTSGKGGDDDGYGGGGDAVGPRGDAAITDAGGGTRTTTRTLAPSGPRLLPPAGLSAIYSLQFYRPDDIVAEGGGGLPPWVVGAGKSGIVALWNCRPSRKKTSSDDEGGGDDDDDDGRYVDPVISWKGHGGRWIADARFLPSSSSHSSSPASDATPGRLLTAGNDGSVCHWDLTSASVKTGSPRLLGQSGKALHSGGIFSMDVRASSSHSGDDVRIVTGSKDRTIAVSALCHLDDRRPLWRSDFHSAKVGSVCFSSAPAGDPLVASASDDGLVAVHDARLGGMRGGGNVNGLVAKLEGAHLRPHSAVWMPGSDGVFATGGCPRWFLRLGSHFNMHRIDSHCIFFHPL